MEGPSVSNPYWAHHHMLNHMCPSGPVPLALWWTMQESCRPLSVQGVQDAFAAAKAASTGVITGSRIEEIGRQCIETRTCCDSGNLGLDKIR